MSRAWYDAALSALKGIFRGEAEEALPVTVVDLGGKEGDPNNRGVPGVRRHKLNLLGLGATLHKVDVQSNNEGLAVFSVHPDVDTVDCTGIWAEPGKHCAYVLRIPGATGPNYIHNFRKAGLIVQEGAKTFKRLKRLISVSTLASTTDFTVRIGNAPERLVDGMAFISLDFVRQLLGEAGIRHGDLMSYSYVGPMGMTKGTLVAYRGLESNLVIHKPNIKEEVKTDGWQALYIEGILRAKVPATDLQTMINAGMLDEFKRSFNKQVAGLIEQCLDPNRAQDWLERDFPSQDWYKEELQSNRERKAEKPHLTIASEMGLHVQASPVLRLAVWKYNAARLDIHDLRATIQSDEDGNEMGCRAYMVPQIDQFNKAGDFEPNPETVLSMDEISFPKWTPELPVVVIRQPNGPGETSFFVNRPGLATAAVQLSPLAICPELSSVYGMPSRPTSVLATHGGADMDDALVGFFHENAIGGALERITDLKANDVPPSNMEALIDRSVQSNTARLDKWEQAFAAIRQEVVPLGEAVNFIMARSLLSHWDVLKLIAQCETDKQLRWVIDAYNAGRWGKPQYPDIWFPGNYKEDRKTWERGAKLPRTWVDPDNWRLGKAYIDAVMVPTSLGKLVRDAGDSMLRLDAHAKDPAYNNDSWLADPRFIKEFLPTIISQDGHIDLDTYHKAEILMATWARLSGDQRVNYTGVKYKKVWEHLLSNVLPSITDSRGNINKKVAGQVWGLIQAAILVDTGVNDKMIITAMLARDYAGKAWLRRPDNSKMFCYKLDSVLWNPAREHREIRGKEYLLPIDGYIGVRECWISILFEWQTRILAEREAAAEMEAKKEAESTDVVDGSGVVTPRTSD